MPFGFGKEIAVLEGKFQIYEDLSKEMLDKLERQLKRSVRATKQLPLFLLSMKKKSSKVFVQTS